MVRGKLSYAYKIGSKSFVDASAKKAYMRAVKWYATHIISRDALHDIHVEFVKSKTEPKVTMTLWAALDEEAAREEHCKICREVHALFYSNTGYDCSKCNVSGYLKRLEQKALIKVEYCKEVIDRESGGTDR